MIEVTNLSTLETQHYYHGNELHAACMAYCLEHKRLYWLSEQIMNGVDLRSALPVVETENTLACGDWCVTKVGYTAEEYNTALHYVKVANDCIRTDCGVVYQNKEGKVAIELYVNQHFSDRVHPHALHAALENHTVITGNFFS
jgi:hypothetical protein